MSLGWLRAAGEVPSGETKRLLATGDGFEVKPTNALLLDTLMSSVEEVAEMLYKRTWTLVVFAEPWLFSGENPVVFINPSGQSMGFGVATAERIYLPVSPTHALVLSHPYSSWPEGRIEGVREFAERLNWAMLNFPTNEELLIHPDVETHPLPSPHTLLTGPSVWWPWDDDPDAVMPAGLRILLGSGRRHRPQVADM